MFLYTNNVNNTALIISMIIGINIYYKFSENEFNNPTPIIVVLTAAIINIADKISILTPYYIFICSVKTNI